MKSAQNDDSTSYNLLADFLTENINCGKTDEVLITCSSIIENKNDYATILLITSYLFKGTVCLLYNDFESSLNFLNNSIVQAKNNIQKSYLNQFLLAKTYYFLGILYDLKGNYNKALSLYHFAIKILKESNISNMLFIKVNINIGTIYLYHEDYFNAIEYYKNAERILEQYGGNNQLKSTIFFNLAGAYFESGEFDKALNLYKKSKKLDPNQSITYYINLGSIFERKEDYTRAIKNTKKALSMLKIIEFDQSLEESMCYNNLASVYRKMNKKDSAVIYYNKSLNIRKNAYGEKHPSISQSYNRLGDFYFKNNNIKAAKYYYKKSILSNSIDMHTINEDIYGKDYSVLSLSDLIDSYYGINNTLKINDSIEIDKNYAKLFHLLDKIVDNHKSIYSKYSYKSKSKDIYFEAIKYYLLKRNNKDKAFILKEKCKSNILYKILLINYSKLSDDKYDSLKVLKKKIQTEISSSKSLLFRRKLKSNNYNQIKSDIFKLEQKLYSLNEKINNSFKDQLNPYSSSNYISQIQDKLESDEALIEYFVNDTNILIYGISNDTIIIKLFNYHSFEKIIYDYSHSIKFLELASYQKYSYLIYKLLIDPIYPILKNKERLIIIPDEYLFYIPFETLTERLELNNNSPSTFSFLIKNFEIVYNYSSSIWLNNNNFISKSQSSYDFIGFAPVFIDSKGESVNRSQDSVILKSLINRNHMLNSLPYSVMEIEEITQLFKNKKYKAKQFLHNQATEENLKSYSDSAKIIHIATHGFSSDAYPELSGILLHNDSLTVNHEDGILFIDEVKNLNLYSDLVVLSSCESGLGTIISGEGIISLSRSLLLAGSNNLIISLWKISDKHSKDLLIEFYNNLLTGDSYSKSLKSAKLRLIEKNSTAFPKFWGGLVLISN